MLDLKLDIDSAPLAREISDIQRKQIPFALVLAQTRLATNRIKPGIAEVMGKRLDRPTPTTMRSLFAQAATKSRGAKVWFKDQWTTGIPADTYLQQAVQGGVRAHKRFEKSLIAHGLMKAGQFAVPNADLLNQYGNVSRGVMTRILSGLGAAEGRRGYQANATGSKRSKRKGNAERFFVGTVGDDTGVWERKPRKQVAPVFLYTDGAPQYRVIFPFFKIGENIAKAHGQAELANALREAILTAK
ncbi:hypothetical protein C6A77_19290 [Pseudomonas sp. AFG_SD02_1510_Pfu_092]|uniref:hypothetical protein n=1 Tax=Pseudomonas sp. AFG_SD02_1510_Pfu_092 TaxID=2259497 RepID=UPI000DF008D4|nr:hypothetical protein [Pseudomonas sp. AFG_SD02_1510_Pfu_092]RCL22984.1 hypothetical protein C6A77_19290 [Pseudomonas sp. AFG_SD02_1510_Pfu_092]